jgi:hypothetical protein
MVEGLWIVQYVGLSKKLLPGEIVHKDAVYRMFHLRANMIRRATCSGN